MTLPKISPVLMNAPCKAHLRMLHTAPYLACLLILHTVSSCNVVQRPEITTQAEKVRELSPDDCCRMELILVTCEINIAAECDLIYDSGSTFVGN